MHLNCMRLTGIPRISQRMNKIDVPLFFPRHSFAIFAFTSILIVIGMKLRSYLMPPKYPKGNLMESAPEVAGSEEDDRE